MKISISDHIRKIAEINFSELSKKTKALQDEIKAIKTEMEINKGSRSDQDRKESEEALKNAEEALENLMKVHFPRTFKEGLSCQ